MRREYLRIKELSELTAIDYGTIHYWVAKGMIRSVKIGSVIIIPISELKQLGIEVSEENLNGKPKEVVQ
jgi:excisionase family DNA binding protein